MPDPHARPSPSALPERLHDDAAVPMRDVDNLGVVTRLRPRGEVSLDPQLLDAEMPRYREEADRSNVAIGGALLAVTFVVFIVLLWPWLADRFA